MAQVLALPLPQDPLSAPGDVEHEGITSSSSLLAALGCDRSWREVASRRPGGRSVGCSLSLSLSLTVDTAPMRR